MLEHIDETTAMDLVRLLLDEDRLRILGLVGREPCSEQMLVAALAVKPNALMRHVRQLRQAGLVAVVVEDGRELYTLDVAAIQRAKRALFAPADAPPVDDEAKTLAVFVHDGRIRHMPTHPDKLRVVLAWLADQFEVGRDYTEAEVNDSLSRHHEDFALWRRYLVDEGWMTRQRGIYRKLERS